MTRVGHSKKAIFAEILVRCERASHVPNWWKGFSTKGLEEQLPEQRKGNRRLGLRGEEKTGKSREKSWENLEPSTC